MTVEEIKRKKKRSIYGALFLLFVAIVIYLSLFNAVFQYSTYVSLVLFAILGLIAECVSNFLDAKAAEKNCLNNKFIN